MRLSNEMLQMAVACPWIADATVNHFQGRRSQGFHVTAQK
ncbi:hypothetical protein T01_10650 [Trichinella spiralis]|uniref:Uncharacterized protein n=1 Tax=Trichinella spiralis TaxID=6334 RepID=A0A0V0Z3X8_TRISP|nr:hypothetical protein T01_10650 [Trichinella spiralis]